MKEEDFDCKFPELYPGKEHGREGTQKKAGAGGSSAVASFNGRVGASLFRVAWGLSGAYKRMVLPNN